MPSKRRVMGGRNAPTRRFMLSATVGVMAGWLLGLYIDGGAISMIFGAVGGASTGFVAAVLVWLGSARLPDDEI